MGNGVDESVLLLIAPDGADKKDGVEHHAADGDRQQHNPYEQQDPCPPVQQDPADIKQQDYGNQPGA